MPLTYQFLWRRRFPASSSIKGTPHRRDPILSVRNWRNSLRSHCLCFTTLTMFRAPTERGGCVRRWQLRADLLGCHELMVDEVAEEVLSLLVYPLDVVEALRAGPVL